MLANFLALGDLVIERVKTELPSDFQLVAHAADLAGVKDSAQITPACHIVYLGARIGTQLQAAAPPPAGKVAWDQDWMTVVVVRSAKDPKRLTGAMEVAGPLCGRLVTTLTGWKADDGVMPLQAEPPGVPPLPSAAGTLYVPLRWRARITKFTT